MDAACDALELALNALVIRMLLALIGFGLTAQASLEGLHVPAWNTRQTLSQNAYGLYTHTIYILYT